MVNKVDAADLVAAGDNIGNICISEEFMNGIRSDRHGYELPKDNKKLRGFPFITSWEIPEQIMNEWKGQGAVWIGSDRSETSDDIHSNKDCMFFIAKKYVAFAILKGIRQSFLSSAEINEVYTFTYFNSNSGIFIHSGW